MITEGDAAIPLETTRRAFGNQEKSKQRSAIIFYISAHNRFHYNCCDVKKSPSIDDIKAQSMMNAKLAKGTVTRSLHNCDV